MPRALRILAGGAAAALLALALGGEALGRGASPGFGPLQRLVLAAAVLVLPLAFLPVAWLRRYAALPVALASIYGTALAFELGLALARGPARNSALALVGPYRPSRWGGYELVPGWHGHYDDGVTRVAVDINADGARDDDRPPARAVLHVVLLGDSQTFGMGLAREATIERQIETQSSEAVAALNLGVPGYGPEDALEHYRERAGAGASHVFFLLYGNDLRLDNCRAAIHTAIDGVIVRRERADGRPARAGELRRRLAERRARSAPDPSAGLRGAALLERLRARLHALRDPESQLLAGAPEEFSEACARRAAGAAASMRALARAHGQRFSVVVLPTAGEAARQRYAAPMRAALAELGRLEVPTLEVRPLLSPGDYLSGDEHLAPSGARKVARAILEAARSAGRPRAQGVGSRRSAGSRWSTLQVASSER